MARALRKQAASDDMSETQFERVTSNAARLAIVFVGFLALLVALKEGQVFLAPVTLAIVIGLMFGPVADRVERFGVPPALSAGVVVLMLIGVIAAGVTLFAVPLSEWVARAPMIWDKLQLQLANLQGPLEAVTSFQAQISSIFGSDSAMAVTVEDGGQMISVARTLNPGIETVVRSHNEEEARLLAQETTATVFLGEQELAKAMAQDVIRRAVPA